VSSRLETLQVARLAANQLGDASAAVAAFLSSQFHQDGGAVDRAGNSDLYYTVFALEGLMALQVELPVSTTMPFLASFGNGADLDLVHRACLARCWASMPKNSLDSDRAAAIATGIESYRADDGGFAATAQSPHGTAYHAFLAHGAYQDLNIPCPDRAGLGESLLSLTTKDGGFANTAGLPFGTTTVTAAAVSLLRHLDRPAPSGVGNWILAQAHPEGGFRANPQAPMPDLLSTATALHALDGLQVDYKVLREHCLDFVDSLWTGKAFCGHWADDAQDSEYTYYALLALGHLSL
jgi:prenyltransferase beta subunit